MGHRLYINKPELYHGRENSRPYFEGWYFKQISPDGKFRMALIPGIYKGRNKEDDHVNAVRPPHVRPAGFGDS